MKDLCKASNFKQLEEWMKRNQHMGCDRHTMASTTAIWLAGEIDLHRDSCEECIRLSVIDALTHND